MESAQLKDLYDTSMWWAYCNNCDQKAIFYDDIIKHDTLTFGKLDFKSSSVNFRGKDTVDFQFDFYKDTIKAHYLEKEAYKICVGLQVKISTKKIIAIIGKSSLAYNIISAFPPVKQVEVTSLYNQK